MLTFAYLSIRNLENLFHFNGMGNFTTAFASAGSCITNVHEIVESVSTNIEKVEYADHNLYRRHVNNQSDQKGGVVNQGHSHLPFVTFRVSSEFKEICASTMSRNRVSGPPCKFCESDSLIALTQGAEGPGGV